MNKGKIWGLLLLLTLLSSLPVYCCCCLANISIPGIGVVVPEFRPFFYVNVADISALENELSYVACKLFHFFFSLFSFWTEGFPSEMVAIEMCLLRHFAPRHNWEDFWGEEGPIRRVCRQSECKNLQGRFEAAAPPQRCRPGEVPQADWAKVGNFLTSCNTYWIEKEKRKSLCLSSIVFLRKICPHFLQLFFFLKREVWQQEQFLLELYS